jgi:hypothetical protein
MQRAEPKTVRRQNRIDRGDSKRQNGAGFGGGRDAFDPLPEFGKGGTG